MSYNFQDITGKVFGRLTAIRYLGQKNNKSSWLCQCECGVEKAVSKDKLKSGSTVSCGCYNREWLKNNPPNCLGHQITKHGMSKTKEYRAWSSAKDRCFNKNCKTYELYGGRGITMYKEWIDSFESFYNYIGKAPTKHHSLDRINTDGNYEPMNVRWATQEKQCNNKSNNVYLEIDGVKNTFTAWCKYYNINRGTVTHRLNKGMGLKEAFTTPINQSKSRSL